MSRQDLYDHLVTGSTQVCQCWQINRKDGVSLGFTDHDLDLFFNGVTFAASGGMSATAIARSTGLAVDNSEAVGLLQSDIIAAEDVIAGRYDGAEVINWLVRWDDVSARARQFQGTIGEITRDGGQFKAELRGLSDAINQPQGRAFLRSCSAVLGDAACGIDLNDPAYALTATVQAVDAGRSFVLQSGGFADRYFDHGRLVVTSGAASGLSGAIKDDRRSGGTRAVALWHPLRAVVSIGDTLRLEAGCDKRAETCRDKFANLQNFQGFPHIPGEDWLMAIPRADTASGDESMNQ